MYLNSECSAPVRTTYSPLARHIMGLARDTGVSVLASLAKQYDLLEQIERAIELYAPAPVKEEENKNIHGNRYPSHKRKRVQ